MSKQNIKKIKNKDYLDKRFARSVCRFIYFLGLGDYWYEPMDNPPIPKKIYPFWCFLSNFFNVSVIASEVLSNLRNDLTVKERNDAVQFSFAHPSIYVKVAILNLKKDKIREFFKTMIEESRLPSTEKVEKAAIRKTKLYIFVLVATMFFCLTLTTIDGIRTHYEEGIPVRTLVTVWPGKYDNGVFVTIIRYVIQFHWWYLLTVMLAVDSVCMTALIYLGFRFRSLQVYFESLKKDFIDNVHGKTKAELEIDMKKAFISGMKMHSRILWCARSLQHALGNVYSTQVVQSITLLAVCLIKLVRIERSLSFLFANFAFMSGLLALTGTYMMAAGAITYEASRVSTSMFHGGWELCSARARLRPLLVVALQCSDRPVIMTAFGVYDLSYSNFISVLRSSYSFFAVMY